MSARDTVACRRAVEALRAGVPNRDAVRFLGTDQVDIQRKFLESVDRVGPRRAEHAAEPGLIIEGGFGTGKSHLIEWLQHLALEKNFVCSRVVVSKETPLNDRHKVFRAAVETMRVPGSVGNFGETVEGFDEIAQQLDPRSPAYADFYKTVQAPDSGFDELFKATLYLYQELRNEYEFVNRIIRFWGGDLLGIGELRRALKSIGAQPFEIRTKRAQELALPRFQFVASLLGALGYAGWIVFVDEVELVAFFSRIARAKAYATLAALSGALTHVCVPGMLLVAASTPDFTREVFETRDDRTKIPELLEGKSYNVTLPDVEAGMDLWDPARGKRRLQIRQRANDSLVSTHSIIKDLYADAYGVDAAVSTVEQGPASRSMRQYVRDWITRWDLERLYPEYEPEIVMEDLHQNLSEITDIEKADEPDEDSGDVA